MKAAASFLAQRSRLVRLLARRVHRHMRKPHQEEDMDADDCLNAVGEDLLGQARVLLCKLSHVVEPARLRRETEVSVRREATG